MTSENQNQRITQVIFSAQTTFCPELQNKCTELAFSIKNDIFFPFKSQNAWIHYNKGSYELWL